LEPDLASIERIFQCARRRFFVSSLGARDREGRTVVKAIKQSAAAALKAQTSMSPALREANDSHRVAAGLVPPPAVCLLSKAEVCAVANRSFPTIWKMMRAGTFPRARVSGAKSFWLSTEVENWIAALPIRPLKGDKRAYVPDPHQSPRRLLVPTGTSCTYVGQKPRRTSKEG
jgi:predicted DNA-binding transcriptional regulator AlpA